MIRIHSRLTPRVEVPSKYCPLFHDRPTLVSMGSTGGYIRDIRPFDTVQVVPDNRLAWQAHDPKPFD